MPEELFDEILLSLLFDFPELLEFPLELFPEFELELFPELVDDPEPERYYDWILWSLRQKMKKD